MASLFLGSVARVAGGEGKEREGERGKEEGGEGRERGGIGQGTSGGLLICADCADDCRCCSWPSFPFPSFCCLLRGGCSNVTDSACGVQSSGCVGAFGFPSVVRATAGPPTGIAWARRQGRSLLRSWLPCKSVVVLTLRGCPGCAGNALSASVCADCALRLVQQLPQRPPACDAGFPRRRSLDLWLTVLAWPVPPRLLGS